MLPDSSDDPFHGLETSGAGHLQRVLGKYELQRPLGRGGMGEVWLAHDTIANVLVALKMLPPELRYNVEAQEQVRASYQRVYKLGHPSICAVKDLVLDSAVGFFLVMDYFDGISLTMYRKQYVALHGDFPVSEVGRILTPVANALDHAHSIGLAHRDIKPANILISRGGEQVRVIDFQLAAEIRSTVVTVSNPRSDTSAGTFPYMALEQFAGQRASAKTDLYALAMVAYELLAGQLPFEFHSWDQWKSLIGADDVAIPAVPGLPASTQRALERGLARHPELRPANCTQFVQSLVQATPDQESGSGKSSSSASRAAERPAKPDAQPVLSGKHDNLTPGRILIRDSILRGLWRECLRATAITTSRRVIAIPLMFVSFVAFFAGVFLVGSLWHVEYPSFVWHDETREKRMEEYQNARSRVAFLACLSGGCAAAAVAVAGYTFRSRIHAAVEARWPAAGALDLQIEQLSNEFPEIVGQLGGKDALRDPLRLAAALVDLSERMNIDADAVKQARRYLSKK
jgi:serine/threonine protein kinase